MVPTLSASVDLVMGIKEPPVESVLSLLNEGRGRKRKWMVFSHTHKGQHYNMELLSKFLGHGNLSPRLIDYELLTDEDGRRTVGFGWYAGGTCRLLCPLACEIEIYTLIVAGALESLSALAHALLEIGVASPFLVRSFLPHATHLFTSYPSQPHVPTPIRPSHHS